MSVWVHTHTLTQNDCKFYKKTWILSSIYIFVVCLCGRDVFVCVGHHNYNHSQLLFRTLVLKPNMFMPWLLEWIIQHLLCSKILILFNQSIDPLSRTGVWPKASMLIIAPTPIFPHTNAQTPPQSITPLATPPSHHTYEVKRSLSSICVALHWPVVLNMMSTGKVGG